MQYVHRNAQNKIAGVSRWPNGSTERLPDDDPELQAYLSPPPPVPEDTDLTARDMERLLTTHLGITPVQIADIKKTRP